MSIIQKLLTYFAAKSYGDLLIAIFELIVILIGLIYVRKQKAGIYFLAYLIFDFIISVCDVYVELSPSFSRRDSRIFIGYTNVLIAMAELLAYTYFFSKIIQSKFAIKLIKLFLGIFVLVIILFVITRYSFLTQRYYYMTNVIATLEFLFLIPPCMAYFFELFKNDVSQNLHERPSFWIVTGIFFYSVISIPYFMIDRFLNENRSDYWTMTYVLFFCIPFCINFMFLARAFLCNRSLTI